MFKYFILILSMISFSVFGAQNKREVQIVTSFYPVYLSTLNIVHDIPGIKLINLTKATTGCLHDYQLTPQDMVVLTKADYFVVNGAGMESFLDKVIKSRKNLVIIEASKNLKLIKDEKEENPHVWLSPSLAIEQVKNISQQLGEFLPEKRALLEMNAKQYISQIEKLNIEMKSEMKSLKNRSFVTFHEAFPYFAQEFDLKISDVIEREPGTEPTSKELVQILKKLKKNQSKVIFAEPQYSAKAAHTIAKESGAKVYHLDPLVTGPLTKDAYLEGMRKNLQVIKEALN